MTSPTPPSPEQIDRAVENVKDYLKNHTGFGTEYDDEDRMAAYYGGHWVVLDTRKIVSAALTKSHSTDRSEA